MSRENSGGVEGMLEEMEERRNLLMKCIEEGMLQESGERVKCYMKCYMWKKEEMLGKSGIRMEKIRVSLLLFHNSMSQVP